MALQATSNPLRSSETPLRGSHLQGALPPANYPPAAGKLLRSPARQVALHSRVSAQTVGNSQKSVIGPRRAVSPGALATSARLTSTRGPAKALASTPAAATGGIAGGGPSYQTLLAGLHALVAQPDTRSGSSLVAAGGPSAEPELREGASGQAVKTLQQRLLSLGFDPKGVDGAFGPDTLAAVRAFQSHEGIAVDGIVGPQTWGKLEQGQPATGSSQPASGSGPLLKEGATGSAVAQLQQRLTALGFDPKGVDGIFGPATLAAVKAFQAHEGIAVDGVVGPQTWGRLGIQAGPAAPSSASSFDQAIAAGAENLVASGYVYPPNDTSQYYYVPDQVGCCADFACDSVGKAGFDLGQAISAAGDNPHYCPSLVDYFKADQEFIPGGPGGAQVGDLVFFDWGDGQADHVAVVTAVDSTGQPTQIAESYDFNLPAHVTNQVSLGNIMGYGRVVNT